MPQREVSTEIPAPPQVVYDLYVDPARFREWQPDVRDVEADGRPDRLGRRWTVSSSGGTTRISGVVLAARDGAVAERSAPTGGGA